MTLEQANRLIRRHAKSGVIIDTNLLLLLWIGSFDRDLIPRFKRTKKYPLSHFDLLVKLVQPVANLVVTPHLMTELSNLSGQLPEETSALFLKNLIPIIQQCAEPALPSKKLVGEPEFPRLGITDVALADIAKSNVLVITDDLPLYLHLTKSRRPAINFTHLSAGVFALSS